MLHRIDGRASYFSPDIFIERCKKYEKYSYLRVLEATFNQTLTFGSY